MRHLHSLLLGVAGFALAWSLWHAYQDHVLLHQLVTALSRAPKAIQESKP